MIGSNRNGAPYDLAYEADLSYRRLEPRLAKVWQEQEVPEALQHSFEERLQRHWPALFELLFKLYGSRYDFFYHLEVILQMVAQAYADRPPDLHTLDGKRETDPLWFQSVWKGRRRALSAD